jgi:hypothetical protein
MEKKNITVYTAISGDFDKLVSHKNTETANYVAFTDQKSKDWEVRKPYDKFRDERRNSRIQKIMPHLFIDTEYSIYLDGNVELLVEPKVLIDEWLKDKDIAVFRHVGRDCIYDEVNACMELKKGTPQDMSEQIRSYAKEEYPRHNGLAECGVIARRHTPRIAELNEKWWIQYERYSERDQLSFPKVFPKEEVNFIESSVWRHPYFKFTGHK